MPPNLVPITSDVAIEESFASLRADALRLATSSGRRIRVVVDGACFDDLPVELGRAGLAHRPLYKGPDRDFMAAGPFLVDPYRMPDHRAGNFAVGSTAMSDDDAARTGAVPAGSRAEDEGVPSDPGTQMEALLALVGPSSAAVFWVGLPEMTDALLYRQLRTINKALIPRGWGRQPAPVPLSVSEDDRSGEDEAVLFRHADGNVLAEVLPVLHAAQYARLFGPAKGIAFLAPAHPTPTGSVDFRAQVPADAPPPTPGMLRLSAEQMHAIERTRLERLIPGAVRYLRAHGGHRVEGIDDRALRGEVGGWLRTGREHGILTEAGLRKWCYLELFTHGRLAKAPGLKALLADRTARETPDERLDMVMSATIAALGGAA